MTEKSSTVEIIRKTAQNKAFEWKTTQDHATKEICNAIKDVESKNKAIKKNIMAYCQ